MRGKDGSARKLNLSVVRLSGGLGNQLHQYAFARSMAITLEEPVLLDLERYGFSRAGLERKCELPRLFPNVEYMRNRVPKLLPRRSLHRILIQKEGVLRRVDEIQGRALQVERAPLFDSNISFKSGNYYVGNFVSYKYWKLTENTIFQEIEDALLARVDLKNIQVPNAKTIAIHIRRGDYVTSGKTRKFHGYCKESYFMDGIQQLLKLDSAIDSVLIASDTPHFAQEFGRKVGDLGLNVSFVDSKDAIYTLTSLSRSKYFIGSNSTFSWWAAFLGSEKKTVFPADWFTLKNPSDEQDVVYPKEPLLLPDALSNEMIE